MIITHFCAGFCRLSARGQGKYTALKATIRGPGINIDVGVILRIVVARLLVGTDQQSRIFWRHAHFIVARDQIIKDIQTARSRQIDRTNSNTIKIRHRRAICIEQLNRASCDRRLARILEAIAIGVLPYVTTNAHWLDEAKVNRHVARGLHIVILIITHRIT